MKFSIPSSELMRGLQAVIGAVPAKATLPILETVLFKSEDGNLSLCATDLEVSIIEFVEANVEEEGAVAIPARRLLETLRQLPDIPVQFEIGDNYQIKFRTDQGVYKLAGDNPDEFPDVPQLDSGITIKSTTEALKDVIRKTSFAVSSDDLRPAMMGVYFNIGSEESRVVATDGHRLVRLMRTDLVGSEETDFITPEKALTLVGKALDEQECEIVVGGEHARFQSGKTIIITRLINEQYPNYESVIPKENDKELKINREQMLSTVRRVSVFASSSTKQMRLAMKSNEVHISAEDIDMSSEAEEVITCEYDNEEMEIGFNAKYLADVLSNIDDPEVVFEFSTPNRAGIVRPSVQDDEEDMLMLVMPVMLNTYA